MQSYMEEYNKKIYQCDQEENIKFNLKRSTHAQLNI